jgi:UDP-N-acetylglucosamine 3-dehydrogenase
VGTDAVGYGDYMEQKVFIHDAEWVKEAKIEKKEPLRIELEHFMKCCSNGEEPLASGEDGINALVVALAAIESYKSSSLVKIEKTIDVPLNLKHVGIASSSN